MKTNFKSQTMNNKSFIIYLISFIPYLFLISSSIFGIDFCFLDSYFTLYGFDALFIAFLIGCLVPIYPIILIFQIIYTIKKHKLFTRKQKIISKWIVILLIVSSLISGILHLIIRNFNLDRTYNQDKIIIENYLKTEFGEQYYNNMEILKPTTSSLYYVIETPLLEHGFQVQLNEQRTEIISNNFYEQFVDEKKLQHKLSEYLNNKLELPPNIKLQINIKKINNYDINNLDLLLNECDYNISGIYIYNNNFDKEEIIKIIKDFYIKYNKLLLEHSLSNSLTFYVEINENLYASIQTIKSSNKKDSLTLIFNGYNYGNGYTIQHDQIDISLSI